MPNMEASNIYDDLETVTRLLSEQSLENGSNFKLKALYGAESGNVASILIQRSLFLENEPIIDGIVRDSCRIYSHLRNKPNTIYLLESNEGLLKESLLKLISSSPMKSFMRLSFRQLINFITSASNGSNKLDFHYLISFINELRVSYSTLCLEDRAVLKPHSKLTSAKTFVNDAREDASFLIIWVIVEGAKYCINHKFAPEMSANAFLDLMRKMTLAPVALGDRISRRILICLLQNLDKLIQDRILESSTGSHTFTSFNTVEQFYQANSSVFRSWFSKNRQNIAQLSLTIGEPAECWRNINFRLCSDLATKLNGFRSDLDSSLSQTLRSLNKKNWLSNLSMLAISAKELKDSPLLHGIRALIDRGLICDYSPLDVIISNLDGNYEKTYNSLINSEDINEQRIIEFLNSCIQLDRLEENRSFIDRLESVPIKELYTNYLASKSFDNNSSLRMTEVEKWLGTWSTVNDSTPDTVRLSKDYINLIIPTCLNVISRTPQDEREDFFKQLEGLMNQDFIADFILPPSVINDSIKLYQTLVDILKRNSILDHRLIDTHQNDLQWNQLLYRHLCDLNLITQLRQNQDGLMDNIQFKAAKFHLRHKNYFRSTEIISDLIKTTSCTKTKLHSSFLLLKNDVPKEENFNHLLNFVKEVKQANLPLNEECDLIANVARYLLKSCPLDSEIDNKLSRLINDADTDHNNEETVSFQGAVNKWQDLMSSSSEEAKIKTSIYLSKYLNSKTESIQNDELYSSAFKADLQLLEMLCNSTTDKHRAQALDCAARLLRNISTNGQRLIQGNLDYFLNNDFIRTTKSVWLILKSNLISLILYQNDEKLTSEWRKGLINVLKIVGEEYPNLLIYSIIVNRLDLQNELIMLNDESSSTAQEPCTLILHSSKEIQESNSKLSDCKARLSFWNELLDHLKLNTQCESKWLNIVIETECFLKEIRKISFLCGEYFKGLTLRIPKKLFNFLDYFSRYWDNESGAIQGKHRLEECEKRLKTVCGHALNQIKVLLNYNKKVGDAHATKYDVWFCETFDKHLYKLEQKLDDLLKKRPLIYSELQTSIKEITDLTGLCRKILLEYNHNNRQKLFMELISPMLSRLEPSLIPMPDCCDELRNTKKSGITIHKISQTVNLIVSKTSPKRLQFVGSDGLTRSFLLKAHEDLRLDQLIMDIFSVINNLFLGHKSTKDKYRLRRYSVTPVSTRSALIQWIEAPSLCSFYRTWLNSPNGKKIVDELYETTCSSLCAEHRILPREQHMDCQPAQSLHQTTDIFYQLLWARIRPTKVPMAQTRPTFNTIIKYHNQFDSSIFESVVEQLINRMPDELVSNQLWYRSNNSYSYWLKTRQFIHSTATMSIVGYMIGLGDRHPENILIDLTTGDVIHIDYNICFELGKTLSIPEQVPFRLTQNIIQAFGFAGLEGGFTMACCDVLDTLKSHQSTLLHLLEPINLSFMIGQPAKVDESKDRSVYSRSLNKSKSKLPFPINNQPEMDMCSQESFELNQPVGDVTDLLILNNSDKDVQVSLCDKIEIIKTSKSQMPHSFDVQNNIETPTKILWKTAVNMHKRIANKLCGTDESISHYGYMQKYNDLYGEQTKKKQTNKKEDRMIDLIMLNEAQITKDQINALILEASSLKNKAAMFEGWVPWI